MFSVNAAAGGASGEGGADGVLDEAVDGFAVYEFALGASFGDVGHRIISFSCNYLQYTLLYKKKIKALTEM